MRIPPYPAKPHGSGQARIRHAGRDIYLGKFGSKESISKYQQFLATLVSGIQAAPPTSAGPVKYTIWELVDSHRRWAEQRYVKNGKPTTSLRLFKLSLSVVLQMFGDRYTNDFGPSCLIQCRASMVQKGWSQRSINQQVSRIRAVWKWGVSREMVRPETLVALQSVPFLRRGEDGARVCTPVSPVPQEHIDAVRVLVTPAVRAMIDLQLLTAMRPGEVLQMRTCDIRPSFGGIWIYIPSSHKTEHRGRCRQILLGPKAQQLLTAWMRPENPEGFLFSPVESMEWRYRRQREQATGRIRKASRRKTNPRKAARARYSTDTYNAAIWRACRKSSIPVWGPNRLRHNAATTIRREADAETARIVLGHSSLDITEIYAERDTSRASKIMARIG
jgi:integrase